MSDVEFRSSTLAKVVALRNRQDQNDKRRDFFVAELVAIKLSTAKKTVSVEDVLAWQYRQKNVVTTPWDDSMGAQGDWESMRDALKYRG